MKTSYNQIRSQYEPYEAAYKWLEEWYGPHVPYMHHDLVAHLVRSVESGATEIQFRRDASHMYNL